MGSRTGDPVADRRVLLGEIGVSPEMVRDAVEGVFLGGPRWVYSLALLDQLRADLKLQAWPWVQVEAVGLVGVYEDADLAPEQLPPWYDPREPHDPPFRMVRVHYRLTPLDAVTAAPYEAGYQREHARAQWPPTGTLAERLGAAGIFWHGQNYVVARVLPARKGGT